MESEDEARLYDARSTVKRSSVVTSSDARENTAEEPVSEKARNAGNSLKDLAESLGRKAKESAEENTKMLKAHTLDLAATVDGKDIGHLGNARQLMLSRFEDALAVISKEPYDEQVALLASYRAMLEKQIGVVTARMVMAKNLKPGA